MEWWQALLMGIVQGLTEFLPVSSSGHLMIFRELLGVDADGFLDFTVLVHFATVLSTIVVFWSVIWKILKGIFKFRYNDETDYFLKICVSMIPVTVVGFFFKDFVEGLFGDSLLIVGVCLCVTAVLLTLSDCFADKVGVRNHYRNGISWWQAFVVGLGQACAVAPFWRWPGAGRVSAAVSERLRWWPVSSARSSPVWWPARPWWPWCAGRSSAGLRCIACWWPWPSSSLLSGWPDAAKSISSLTCIWA